MMECRIDGCSTEANVFRCKEHWHCDTCGTKESLCYGSYGLFCNKCHKDFMNEKVKSFDGNTEYTNEIVCPYCGTEVGDSWEMPDDESEYDCGECENTFSYTRDVDVTYSTRQK